MSLLQSVDPIFVAYAALIVMAVIPIFFGSFHALEEVKVMRVSLPANPLIKGWFLRK
jgi:hypothetical protein